MPASALVTSACCLLPTALGVAGLGGAWLAAFTPLIALALPLAGMAILAVLAAWAMALRRASPMPWKRLAFQTAATVVALAILLNETRLIEFLNRGTAV